MTGIPTATELDTISACDDVLDVEFSSPLLEWPGVILEKGSPHFYPQNVYTSYFYFALAIERFALECEKKRQSVRGKIWPYQYLMGKRLEQARQQLTLEGGQYYSNC